MERYLSELKTAKPIGGGLSLFEMVDPITHESHIFHIAQSENYLYVGSVCNAGFSYSAHMEKDNDFSIDENLQVLYDVITDCLYNGQEIIGEI